jgi:hypothetical protein
METLNEYRTTPMSVSIGRISFVDERLGMSYSRDVHGGAVAVFFFKRSSWQLFLSGSRGSGTVAVDFFERQCKNA